MCIKEKEKGGMGDVEEQSSGTVLFNRTFCKNGNNIWAMQFGSHSICG